MVRPPSASVAIPNCNRPSFLARRLESSRTQTCRGFELINLDNGLTDRSSAVFERFAGDPRVLAFSCDRGLPPQRLGAYLRFLRSICSLRREST